MAGGSSDKADYAGEKRIADKDEENKKGEKNKKINEKSVPPIYELYNGSFTDPNENVCPDGGTNLQVRFGWLCLVSFLLISAVARLGQWLNTPRPKVCTKISTLLKTTLRLLD